ncbi:MAG: RNA polymerase sigma factor [Gemmataceae bacterium]
MSDEVDPRTRGSLLARLGVPGDRGRWNEAWRQFYHLYTPLIRSWCRAHRIQEADADEVTSSVLLSLSRRMTNFEYDPTARFRSWLRAVVRHEVIDYQIQKSRLPQARGGESGPGECLTDPAAAAEALAAELEGRRAGLGRAMAAVRQRIAAHTWEAFRRTAVEGDPAEEVARTLKMSIVAVYKAKSRVLGLIREEVRR